MRRIAWPPRPPAACVLLLAALAFAASPVPADEPKPKPKGAAAKKAGAPKAKADAAKSTPEEEAKVEAAARRKDAALKSAEAYLVLLDKGKYAEAWESMTAGLKRGITRRKWVDALGKTRTPFGQLAGRKLARVQMRATEVADRLDEAWVYTTFRTLDGEDSTELIIVALQGGKDWVVSSYYIGDPQAFPKPQAEDKDDTEPEAKRSPERLR